MLKALGGVARFNAKVESFILVRDLSFRASPETVSQQPGP